MASGPVEALSSNRVQVAKPANTAIQDMKRRPSTVLPAHNGMSFLAITTRVSEPNRELFRLERN